VSLALSGPQRQLIALVCTNTLRGVELHIGYLGPHVARRGPHHAKRLLQSADLRVGGFELPVRWDDDESTYQADLQQLGPWAEAAASIGARGCVATVMPASDERSFKENFELHRSRIAEIAEILAPHEIWVGLGFLAPAHHRRGRLHQFIATPDALLTLMKTVVGSNVGVCVDFWHWHVAGGTVEQLRELAPEQIVAVRVADVPDGIGLENIEDDQRLLPGATGIVPAAAALELLAEIGYRGPVTAYPHPRQCEGTKRDQLVQQAADALGRIWPSAVTDEVESEEATTAR
jgi:sugar phosphate isomerase/epimerase